MSSTAIITDEAKQNILHDLQQPFSQDDVKWKPQSFVGGGKALAVAYADPRAYIERLNDVLGVGGWTSTFEFWTCPMTKIVKGKKAWQDQPATPDQSFPSSLIICRATVTIFGIGSYSSTQDADASDDNAATTAEAGAFKRACLPFGLGRYFYDLPKQELPWDGKNKRFTVQPTLPDWATPKFACDDCGQDVKGAEFQGKEFTSSQLLVNSQKKYQKNLCMPCQQKRAAQMKVHAGDRLQQPTA